MSFSSLGLAERVSSNVAALGYTTPTPIQMEAIPAVMAGRDLIGLAQTGTGKTAAFSLPMISKLSTSKSRAVRALIVAPTRELAQQIVESIKKYAEGTGLKSCAIYGGVRMGSQLKRLREGVDIVVGCPGRLCDHIQRKTLDLSKIEMLVLDEADHMFDMGFLPDIKKLVSFVPKQRQTLLFSATMPKEIRGLAEAVLTDPQSIKVSNGEMAATVTHSLFPVSNDLKSQLLEKILKQFEVKSTIIFARTKMRTKRLADSLQRNGYKVASLQGNLSQQRRQDAINGFREGKFDVLVATDLAARGIDVQQVTHVINFDIPMTVEGYTHRIGRTGRAAREGEAFTLICGEDEGKVRAIERHMGVKIERRRVDDFDYGKDAYNERAMSSGGAGSTEKSARPEGSRRSRPFNRSGPKTGGDRNSSRGPRAPRAFGNRNAGRFGGRSEDRTERSASDKAPGFRREDSRRDDARPARFQGPRAEGRFAGRSDGPRERPMSDRSSGFRGGSSRPRRDGEFRPRADRSMSDRSRSDRPRSDRPMTERRDSERPAFNRESYAKKRGFTGDREVSNERPMRERSDSSRSFGARSGRPAGRSFSNRSERPAARGFRRDDRGGAGRGDRAPSSRGPSNRSGGRFKSRPTRE